MGKHSKVVDTVHNKSRVCAVAEAVFEQAFRDLTAKMVIRSGYVQTRRDWSFRSAKAFLLGEDKGWRNSRGYWASLAKFDVGVIESETRKVLSKIAQEAK